VSYLFYRIRQRCYKVNFTIVTRINHFDTISMPLYHLPVGVACSTPRTFINNVAHGRSSHLYRRCFASDCWGSRSASQKGHAVVTTSADPCPSFWWRYSMVMTAPRRGCASPASSSSRILRTELESRSGTDGVRSGPASVESRLSGRTPGRSRCTVVPSCPAPIPQ